MCAHTPDVHITSYTREDKKFIRKKKKRGGGLQRKFAGGRQWEVSHDIKPPPSR